MAEKSERQDRISDLQGSEDASIRYPKNRLISVVNNLDSLEDMVDELTAAGFPESDIVVGHGRSMADKLAAESGHVGLADIAIRALQSIGMPDEETSIKSQYADALRDGNYVLLVQATSEEKKQQATKIVRRHGAKFVNFLGRYTLESIAD